MQISRLLAHWPLENDARDTAGVCHGTVNNIAFRKRTAFFNGRYSVITIPDCEVLRPGCCNFSLSVWIKCEAPMETVFGDVLSKFDSQMRRGFNILIAGSAPGYNGMSDSRHIHFGIDDGYVADWEDWGKPWQSNSLVPCLIVFEGDLYCGIADADDPQDAAHVFRRSSSGAWIDCGRLGHDANHLAVQSMIVHNGRLYAGTGIWDWERARHPTAEFPQPAVTRVFRYEGGTGWSDLGPVGHGGRVLCMASFRGELYAGLDFMGNGRCFKHDGTGWIDCGSPEPNTNLQCLFQLKGRLYAASLHNVYRFEGDQLGDQLGDRLGGRQWECIAERPFQITQIHTMKVFEGTLVIGTWPQGYVLRWDGGKDWSVLGRLGVPEGHRECNEINDLAVHNGKLYAGVIPKAQVYRFEKIDCWTLLNSLAGRADWSEDKLPSWCRVTSLTTFGGKLIASTGSCKGRAVDVDPDGTLGRIYALQTGQLVSHEFDIGNEWTHLAVVRTGGQLHLYVNGGLSQSSGNPGTHTFNLSTRQPLLVGSGPQSHFRGFIADLRFYEGSLDESEIRELSNRPDKLRSSTVYREQ